MTSKQLEALNRKNKAIKMLQQGLNEEYIGRRLGISVRSVSMIACKNGLRRQASHSKVLENKDK